MKTICPIQALFVAALSLNIIPSIEAVTYRIHGEITSFVVPDVPGGVTYSNFGITAGDTFEGFLSYDETATDRRPLPESGWYVPGWDGSTPAQNNLTLTARGATFVAPISSLNVGNGASDRLNIWGGIFPFEDQTGRIQTPWGDRSGIEFDTHDLFGGVFVDHTGTALTSTALPLDLDLSHWISNFFYFRMSLGREGDASLQARITSLERVPETGETAMLLGLSLLGILAVRQATVRTRSG